MNLTATWSSGRGLRRRPEALGNSPCGQLDAQTPQSTFSPPSSLFSLLPRALGAEKVF